MCVKPTLNPSESLIEVLEKFLIHEHSFAKGAYAGELSLSIRHSTMRNG
jgi:hypothetical protein